MMVLGARHGLSLTDFSRRERRALVAPFHSAPLHHTSVRAHMASSNSYFPHLSAVSSNNPFVIGDPEDEDSSVFAAQRQGAEVGGGGGGGGGTAPAHVSAGLGTRLGGAQSGAAARQLANARYWSLGIRVAIAIWAILVFCFAAAILSRMGGVATLSRQCDDSNACTRDMLVSGGCQRLPMPDGTTCAGDPMARCYVQGLSAPAALPPGTTPAPATTPVPSMAATFQAAGPWRCRAGTCTGRQCAGSCSRSADCPTILVRGIPRHANCIWATCMYSESAEQPVTTQSCDTLLFSKMCSALLTPERDPYAECLLVDPICQNGKLVCVYAFSCATPVPPQFAVPS